METSENGGLPDGAGVPEVPVNRDKRANFVRLAEKRTQNVIQKVRVLSNLSNHHVYEYGDADVEEIFDAIQQELTLARSKFEARNKSKPEFALSRRDSSHDVSS
jgi:hypothetical protein